MAWYMNAGYFRRRVQVSPNSVTQVVVNVPVHEMEQSR